MEVAGTAAAADMAEGATAVAAIWAAAADTWVVDTWAADSAAAIWVGATWVADISVDTAVAIWVVTREARFTTAATPVAGSQEAVRLAFTPAAASRAARFITVAYPEAQFVTAASRGAMCQVAYGTQLAMGSRARITIKGRRASCIVTLAARRGVRGGVEEN